MSALAGLSLRPNRGATAADIIGAGQQDTPFIFPSNNVNTTSPLNDVGRASGAILSDLDDTDDDNADTQGFLVTDENIFERGPRRRKSHVLKQSRSIAAPKSAQPFALPENGNRVHMNGEFYEFLGYIGDGSIELSDEEAASFRGSGEYAEFGSKFFKHIGKGLKSLAASKTTGGTGNGEGGLFKTALYRKARRTSSFDGMQEYEYYTGAGPEYSSLFGIKLKKIGKALKKATKAVGKGIKNASKFTVKSAGKLGKFAVKAGLSAVGADPALMDKRTATANGTSDQELLAAQQRAAQQMGGSYDDEGVLRYEDEPGTGYGYQARGQRRPIDEDGDPTNKADSKLMMYLVGAAALIALVYLIVNRKK